MSMLAGAAGHSDPQSVALAGVVVRNNVARLPHSVKHATLVPWGDINVARIVRAIEPRNATVARVSRTCLIRRPVGATIRAS